MASGSVTAAGVPSNPSIFGTVSARAEGALRLANRVEGIVDRLCGSVPIPPESSAPRAVPSGLFDEAMDNAMAIDAQMDRIARAMDRLENKLP